MVAVERLRQRGAVKVPEITAVFWVVKVLTTGMGEAASDWLGALDVVLAAVLGLACAIGLVVALVVQLRHRRYVPVAYWAVVSLVAVFGTVAADGVHVGLGIPYAGSTAFWAVAVALVLWRWHRREGTLDVHSITTRRRELYYWATVLATFALGTAAGDLTAAELHLGYLVSGFLFAAAIVVPLVGWRLGLDPVVAFWAAYVLTRPLGASFADWAGKPSGLAIGDGTVTLVLVVAIAGLVGYLAVREARPGPLTGT